MSTLLNETKAAELLGIATGTLQVWRCLGRYNLPYVKVGRMVRYREADLVAWMEKRTRHHTGDAA